MGWKRRWCVPVHAIAAFLFVGLPQPASAADTNAEAERLIRHGIELRQAHDDEGAVREFQQAYKLAHTPRALGQLGLAEQAVGRWEEAEQHVREAIEASNDPWVAKYHDSLVRAMGVIQHHLGRVEIIGEPEGAEVSVNGRAVGRLPLADAITVSIGDVDIEVRAPGYEAAQRTVRIVAGQYQRVVLRLSKEAQPLAPKTEPEAVSQVDAPPPRPDRTAVQVDPAPKVPAQPKPAIADPSAARTALKWTAAGLGVASLAVGVTFTIIQEKNVVAFDQSGTCVNINGTAYWKNDTSMKMPECQDALSKSILDSKLAIAGYVGAGVFAATWLILQLTEPSRAAPPAERALATPVCAPVTGARLGLACALRF